MASVTIAASDRIPGEEVTDLRAALRRSERRRGLRAAALLAPLAIFMVACFFAPIALLLTNGFTDREVSEAWPVTASALREWHGTGVPDAPIVMQIALQPAVTASWICRRAAGSPANT